MTLLPAEDFAATQAAILADAVFVMHTDRIKELLLTVDTAEEMAGVGVALAGDIVSNHRLFGEGPLLTYAWRCHPSWLNDGVEALADAVVSYAAVDDLEGVASCFRTADPVNAGLALMVIAATSNHVRGRAI